MRGWKGRDLRRTADRRLPLRHNRGEPARAKAQERRAHFLVKKLLHVAGLI